MTLSLDGSASGVIDKNTSGSISLTTSSTNDIVIVAVLVVSTGTSLGTPPAVSVVSDADGHIWRKRKQFVGNNVDVEEWYAVASSALSSDSITVNLTASGTAAIAAFGVSGANTSSPYDTNASLPATATGTVSPLTVNINTSNANDFIIGIGGAGEAGAAGSVVLSVGTGYTSIQNIASTEGKVSGKQQNNVNGGAEYQIVSAAKTSFAVNFTESTNKPWALIADALVASSSTSVSISDSGHGSDTEALTVSFGLADTAHGTNTDAISVQTNLADTAHGTNIVSTASPILISDSGSGINTQSIQAQLSLTDSGAGINTQSIKTQLPLTDSGHGTDLLSLTANVPADETGVSTQTLGLDVSLPLADAGHGTNLISIEVLLESILTELGHGVDTSLVEIISQQSINEAGRGTDSGSSSIFIPPFPPSVTDPNIVVVTKGAKISTGVRQYFWPPIITISYDPITNTVGIVRDYSGGLPATVEKAVGKVLGTYKVYEVDDKNAEFYYTTSTSD